VQWFNSKTTKLNIVVEHSKEDPKGSDIRANV